MPIEIILNASNVDNADSVSVNYKPQVYDRTEFYFKLTQDFSSVSSKSRQASHFLDAVGLLHQPDSSR
jgi:hypothetical protein